MSCKKCSDCSDNGCAPIVYPKCILTTVPYSCLGLEAGVTGQVLFSAIETYICALNASVTQFTSTISSLQSTIAELEARVEALENP